MAEDNITNKEIDALDVSKPAPAPLPPTPSAPPKPTNIAEDVGLPVREITPPPLPPTGVPANDLTRILEEIKLPERKDFRGGADAPNTPPVVEFVPEPAPIPQTPPELKPRDIMSAVHTLKDDFQTAVYDNKLSVVQAAALEEEKRAHKRPDEEAVLVQIARRRHAFGVLFSVVSLLTLGIIALGAVFLIIRDRSGITPTTFLVEGLLFSEQTIPLPIQNRSEAELKKLLADARTSSGLTLGAITRVAPIIESQTEAGEPVQKEATTREFFASIDAHVPEELLRALGDEFFFGFHTVDENAPLIIIPVTSYERAFAGALAWEKTINTDLAPIFTAVPAFVRQADGLLVERTFSDAVMRNYDVRVLKDDTGTIQMYYSFPTRGLIIISESPYSFAEILSRLRADRRL